jgi:hypothetical protein
VNVKAPDLAATPEQEGSMPVLKKGSPGRCYSRGFNFAKTGGSSVCDPEGPTRPTHLSCSAEATRQ